MDWLSVPRAITYKRDELLESRTNILQIKTAFKNSLEIIFMNTIENIKLLVKVIAEV